MIPLRLHDKLNIVRAPLITNEHGNQVPDWLNVTRQFGVPADVQPDTTTEQAADRQTTVTRWRIWLPAGTDVLVTDRLEWAGLTLEVDGEPDRWRRRSVAHHVELLARRVEG